MHAHELGGIVGFFMCKGKIKKKQSKIYSDWAKRISFISKITSRILLGWYLSSLLHEISVVTNCTISILFCETEGSP